MPLVSLTEFAELYEVAPQRIHELVQFGLPATPGKSGKQRQINVRTAMDWLVRREVEKIRTPDGGETIAEASLRKSRADADWAEIKAAQANNELMLMADMQSLIERLMILAATQLDGIAGRVAAQIAAEHDPAVCRQIIFDETRRIREAMAHELETSTLMAHSGQNYQAATTENTGSMGGSVPNTTAG